MSDSLYAQLRAKLRGKMGTANGRLFAALGCYAVLLAAALYVLLPTRTSDEQFLLGAVLLVFAMMIVKTLVHSRD